MKKVYVVDSTPEEREELLALLKGGEARVRKTNRARILLLADEEGRTDEEIAQALLRSASAVRRTRKRFVEGGWSGLSTSRHVPVGSASLRASRRRIWWLWPVVILLRARSAGACSCWPIGW